jgi:hypothetical protein
VATSSWGFMGASSTSAASPTSHASPACPRTAFPHLLRNAAHLPPNHAQRRRGHGEVRRWSSWRRRGRARGPGLGRPSLPVLAAQASLCWPPAPPQDTLRRGRWPPWASLVFPWWTRTPRRPCSPAASVRLLHQTLAAAIAHQVWSQSKDV